MGYDPFVPISLAQVNVLCLPVGRVTAHKFDEYITAFRAFSLFALRNSSQTSSFSTYKEGHVLLNVSKNTSHYDDHAGPSGFNLRPQIVLGLADGEQLSLNPGQELEEWLESASATLRQSTHKLNPAAVSALVVLGGSAIPQSEDALFVDLEGDGPSLLDTVTRIVGRFQSRLEILAHGLTNNDDDSKPSDEDARSVPPHRSEQGSETIRNPSIRTDSPASRAGQNTVLVPQRNEKAVKCAVLSGQLYLLAGQWPEALQHFSDGAIGARNDTHQFWHAQALEGLLTCMLLFAWAHLNFGIPPVCYPTTDRKAPVYSSASMLEICASNRSAADSLSSGKSPSSVLALTQLLPQLLSTIMALYERAAGITQDAPAFRMLCQSRIRWGNLLLVVRKHGNTLHDTSLQVLIECRDSVFAEKPTESSAALFLSAKAMTKLFTDAAFEAQSRLPVQQSAAIQIAIASSFSRLEVERKQAFHLREFLQRLGPALIEARRAGAAEIGIHPSASLPPLQLTNSASNGASQAGIQLLLNTFSKSYGLLSQQDRASKANETAESRLQHALQSWSAAHSFGDVSIKIEVLNLCVEVSDAVPDLQCSLDFMTHILQISTRKPTLSLQAFNPSPILPASEQSRIIQNIRRVVSAAVRYSIPNTFAYYWDKCLVRLIGISEESSSNKLIPRTVRDLSLTSKIKNEVTKDPFIFNPFAKSKGGTGQSVIVVGEQTQFYVLLQNSLEVDVEIEDIVLISEGCDFLPDHHSIVLGPLCSQVFTLTGKAQEEGNLVITGCRATIRGCHAEDFLIVHGNFKLPHITKQLNNSITRQKNGEVVLPEIKQLSLKVIAPLPKLTIVDTSLLQQSLMLLEGEKTTMKLTLRNDSSLVVDLVLLTFEDSVTKRLEEALGNKDLLPADLYEVQNQIATRPVARLVDDDYSNEKAYIAPHSIATFSVEIFGRPGLTEVNVLVDYTYLGKPREDVHETFYTRQLRHTIATTINGSIDIPRCSVLPLEGNLLSAYNKKVGHKDQATDLSNVGTESVDDSQCMLLLDVRNIWPQPLDVEFRAKRPSISDKDDGGVRDDAFAISETLQPGQMTRLLLLAPRVLITDPYVPIPSLDTKRQFVVSASKMTIEGEAASRESFWYREKLLECLRANWKEQNGGRTGEIDMRKGIRLSSRMIDALRIDLVEISFSLKSIHQSVGQDGERLDTVNKLSDSQYSLARNTFASLVTHVHNRSAETLRLLLRLQPSIRMQPHNIALDLSKRMAWTGILQRALNPPMKPGERREVELGIIALAEGQYEVNATVEEIKSRNTRAETSVIEVGSGTERRIWHARQPCWIDAVDEKP